MPKLHYRSRLSSISKQQEKGKEQLRIFFVNRYFFPDHSATSQLLTDVAFHLAAKGNDVHIVTSRQRYDEPNARLEPLELHVRLTIHRIWTTSFGRGHLLGRAVDYLTFYFVAWWLLRGIVKQGDVIVAKTDPPLISVVAAWAARRQRTILVNWLQDLFPEVAARLNVMGMRGAIGRALQRLRDSSLRRAHMNIAVGNQMAQKIASLGIPERSIEVVHNWADGDAIHPLNDDLNLLRAAWDLGGKFIVGYSGNMGRAHEFETILAAAEILKYDQECVFLFTGGGQQRVWVERQSRNRRLRNVVLKPYQPRESLRESLAVPHVHLISLLPALEGLIVPSKFYGIAAAGRPTVFVGNPAGEIPQILARHGIGTTVLPGHASELVAVLLDLKADPEKRMIMGHRARQAFATEYDKGIAMQKWETILRQVRPDS